MMAHSAWPTAYQASETARSLRRSSPLAQPASSGAPTNITAAAIATSWPASDTDTSSEAAISLSVPTTTITPSR